METQLDEDALELAGCVADFTDRHPQISVVAPDASGSGLWEVRIGGSVAAWDDGDRMFAYLVLAYDT
jgi:hypothetical protein